MFPLIITSFACKQQDIPIFITTAAHVPLIPFLSVMLPQTKQKSGTDWPLYKVHSAIPCTLMLAPQQQVFKIGPVTLNIIDNKSSL